MTAGVVFFTFHTSYPSLWLKLVPSMILSCDKDPTDNEVKDYTITFSYSDGRKIKIAFLGTEYDINNQSPSMLRMSNNEDPMTRQ